VYNHKTLPQSKYRTSPFSAQSHLWLLIKNMLYFCTQFLGTLFLYFYFFWNFNKWNYTVCSLIEWVCSLSLKPLQSIHTFISIIFFLLLSDIPCMGVCQSTYCRKGWLFLVLDDYNEEHYIYSQIGFNVKFLLSFEKYQGAGELD
jgi:hypothetical protein